MIVLAIFVVWVALSAAAMVGYNLAKRHYANTHEHDWRGDEE